MMSRDGVYAEFDEIYGRDLDWRDLYEEIAEAREEALEGWD